MAARNRTPINTRRQDGYAKLVLKPVAELCRQPGRRGLADHRQRTTVVQPRWMEAGCRPSGHLLVAAVLLLQRGLRRRHERGGLLGAALRKRLISRLVVRVGTEA